MAACSTRSTSRGRSRWCIAAHGSALPGFGPALGLTLLYLCLLVLIPLCGVFVKTATLTPGQFWQIVTDRRGALRVVPADHRRAARRRRVAERGVRRARRVGAGPLSVPGTPRRRRARGPALCTADGGGRHRADLGVLAHTGWIGRVLEPLGIPVAFTPLGIIVALTFIGLPFVVRTVQPVLQDLDPEIEEAAVEPRGDTRAGVPPRDPRRRILPAVLTGFTLAFARALGDTDRSCSSRGTCRCGRRSRRCSS